jgi:hypothetical protein
MMTLFSAGVAAASSRPSDDALAAITARGVLLAGYDAAAWQSTDAATATHPSEGLIERYIARKTDAGWVVDFGRLNGSGDKFLVAYEAVQTGSSARYEVKRFAPVREDVGWNLSAAKAVELVTKDFGATTRPYNIAVLPGDAGSLSPTGATSCGASGATSQWAPALPASVENVTVDQELNSIAVIFKGIVTYGICTVPRGESTFRIDFFPVSNFAAAKR